MDELRPQHLPPAGHPLLVVPATATADSYATWHIDGQTWLAPVLDGGLIAWSRSRPMTPATARPETTRLTEPGLLDRVRGEEPHRPDLLPQRGQPLLVDFDLGVAYWMHDGELMHGPWFDDGLIGWGPVGPVAVQDAEPDQRATIRSVVRILRTAALCHAVQIRSTVTSVRSAAR